MGTTKPELTEAKAKVNVEAEVGIAKSGNEVTDFGVDYDGAISAGKDGWQCGNCGKWNKKEHWVCKFCVEYDD